MPTHPPTLDDILDKAIYWLRDGGGDFFARTNEAHGIGEHVVLREALCAVHPLLPRAIESMLTPRKSNDPTLSTRGELVRYTVEYLLNRTVSIHPDDTGHYVFHEMLGIYQRTQSPDVIHITGKVLKFRSCNNTGPDVPLVLCSNTITQGFPHSVLDRAHPEWSKRLGIAQSLDLPLHDQVAYVFETVPRTSVVATAQLPDVVSFDDEGVLSHE